MSNEKKLDYYKEIRDIMFLIDAMDEKSITLPTKENQETQPTKENQETQPTKENQETQPTKENQEINLLFRLKMLRNLYVTHAYNEKLSLAEKNNMIPTIPQIKTEPEIKVCSLNEIHMDGP